MRCSNSSVHLKNSAMNNLNWIEGERNETVNYFLLNYYNDNMRRGVIEKVPLKFAFHVKNDSLIWNKSNKN